MAVSRREGSSEEVTSNAIRIGAAAMILGAVGSILSLLIGSYPMIVCNRANPQLLVEG
ncbi:hypothetical protein [Corynebacterium sp. HS2168-gen11]|uniref:hypothetical protein n=1 Tax=Corynebacterium sp. HS2168-gen11 TaxID=2974027 RepID=UPI00216B275B|nr:hypothetical protein [Corynebacterium sp. HS2168-gen11]